MYEARVETAINNLKKNNFDVFFAENTFSAKDIFLNKILPGINFTTISYADSITMKKTGVLEEVKNNNNYKFIETFDHEMSREERMGQRRIALNSDLFLTGTNAITEDGHLVNLDMVGNRVAAITFGPKSVVLFVGVNKIVKNLEEAIKRIKNISAPLNAKRHTNFKLPCQKTGVCQDCNCPDRICNTWTITEKSYPKKRIKVLLLDEELGY